MTKNEGRAPSRPHRDAKAPPSAFPIVGIGASAGGLEALTELFGALPPSTGAAFVCIQHLAPDRPGLLTEALRKTTRMPLQEAVHGARVQPNRVYVIPSNADLKIHRGELRLSPRHQEPGHAHMPIDTFFDALAADRGAGAVGVVLSGTATDGTAGLRAIRAEGGVTLAQDPETAKFGGMPESALQAGVVDFSGSVPELARELVRLAKHPYLSARRGSSAKRGGGDDLAEVFTVLRRHLGADFQDYKPATVKRRLARRMALRKVSDIREYLQILQDQPDEARALFEDVLVHVTSFFRDSELFKRLQEVVFPEIMRQRAAAPIRIWVSGCATGEEAYSLAIALVEYLGDAASDVGVQIFASDISERSIAAARVGFYAEQAVRGVSAERLRRFFVKVEGGYRIGTQLRDLCVFVKHDLQRDPPFLKLDLVSCRNVLIYFNQALQRRILATFHYCLNQPGFLVLGKSESIGAYHQLFTVRDKSSRLFQRSAVPSRLGLPRTGGRPSRGPSADTGMARGTQVAPGLDLGRQVDALLLGRYAPPGVVVNEAGEVVQFRGRTGPYLEPPPGQPQQSLFKMAREGLLGELRVALGRAKRQQAVVRREAVRFRQDGSTKSCTLVVIPVAGAPESSERLYAVLFEPVASPLLDERLKRRRRSAKSPKRAPSPRTLAAELQATKDYLHSLIEEHERVNQELTSANDELISSNEELQSINEELETAKEELQSTNEELVTVNDEMQNRNQELDLVNNDLINVLNSVEIPILILDSRRRIRRFTPKARTIMNLLPSDVGRPFDDIKSNISLENLDQLIAEVLETVSSKELEVRDRAGRWQRIQIRPYKTLDNKIDGAVLSLVDIDTLKNALTEAEWARDYANRVVDAVQIPLAVIDERLAVISTNEAFHEAFGGSKRDAVGEALLKLAKTDGAAALDAALATAFRRDQAFQGVELVHSAAGSAPRVLSCSARPFHAEGGMPMALVALEDVSERRQHEAERAELFRMAEEARSSAERANRTKDLFLATLSHELRTPLSSLLLQVSLLRRGNLDADKLKTISKRVERAVRAQAQLIDDLLDVSRIVSGKLEMLADAVNVRDVVANAAEMVSPTAEQRSIALDCQLDTDAAIVIGDFARLQQVVWNLLTNAIKFTAPQGRVSVTLGTVDGWVRLRVSDTGVGIEPGVLSRVFDRFMQADSALTRTHGGLGLGLAIARHVTELHGGTITAESGGRDQGSTFTVMLPLGPTHADSAKAQRPAAPEPHVADLRGRRLLVVEDDDSTREALAEMLRDVGAEVRAAASSDEGMRLFDELAPEAIVCDIAMPVEDGYAFLGRVRQRGAARGGDVPAIALTALASDDDRRRALAAGFREHIAKPVDFDRVAAALVEILEAPHAPPGAAQVRAVSAPSRRG